MLNDAEIADLRAEVLGDLNTTATVLRKSQVSDSSGGFADTYTAVATYPCTMVLFPIRPREVEASERIQNIRYWQFLFPYTADVQPTDRLVSDSRTFEVDGTGHDSYNVDLIVTALEIV